MPDIFVGIDTSNYTTSVALCDGAGQVRWNGKRPLAVKEGERGLRQSDAVFAHTKNLPDLLGELKEYLHPEAGEMPTVRGIAVSVSPRRSEGSYMPCFLSGRVAAEALSAATGAPIFEVSHQEGHIMAALYSAGALHLLECGQFAAFHVSGGTTDVLLVHPTGKRLDIQLLGTSLDLHAGQAVDRVGVALGLAFPCGPALEALAGECTADIPKPRICVKGLDCHLSGLENLALSLYERTEDRALVAAYTLGCIGATLGALCEGLRTRYPDIPVVFSGGVMSNRRIGAALASRFADTYFSEPAYSADNAAGVALLGRRALQLS